LHALADSQLAEMIAAPLRVTYQVVTEHGVVATRRKKLDWNMDYSFLTKAKLRAPAKVPIVSPDPAGFAPDSWHPADWERGFGFSDFQAAPTLSRVEWMGFDEKTLAGNATELTLVGLIAAYCCLPDRLAVESIILAHVGYIHAIVYKWMEKHLGDDAVRLEQRGKEALLSLRSGKETKKAKTTKKTKRTKKTKETKKAAPKGGATIAEDLFSIGLLTLVEVVPVLPDVGRKGNWDELDAPDRIAPYLGTAASNAIKDYLDAEAGDHERIKDYLAGQEGQHDAEGRRVIVPWAFPKEKDLLDQEFGVCVARPHVPRKDKEEKEEEKEREDRPTYLEPRPRAIYHAQNPDLILQAKEAKERSERRVRLALDHACKDVIDRLLLTMKREGKLTERQMGDQVELSRDQVHRRLHRLHLALEEEMGLLPLPACKRASRKPQDPDCDNPAPWSQGSTSVLSVAWVSFHGNRLPDDQMPDTTGLFDKDGYKRRPLPRC
jgi:RNA polymerase sigma factor (sigma-70 family)